MKWIKNDDSYRIHIKSWCEDVEPDALKQAINLAKHPATEHHVALMPDCHVGYGMPIGGVIATKGVIIPSAVGVDIGCGMIAAETNIDADRLAEMSFRRAIQKKIKGTIPVGDGIHHEKAQDWEGFEEYADKIPYGGDFIRKIDRHNLGTLGGGNHFIEIQASDKGKVWMMIHSGSRNLGKRIEEHHHKIAARLCESYRVNLPDRDLAFLPIEEDEGHAYYNDMLFALRYAKENRRRMMQAVKEIFTDFVPETEYLQEIDIHHNYATFETHFGQKLCIHRKGATSAKLDEIGIIPGSMGTSSYIVRGLGNPDSFMSCSHGAGRRLSRMKACLELTQEECDKAMEGIVCDRWHRFNKQYVKRTKGALDFSEAPQAYKSIDDVIASELDLIEPIVKLRPLAVLKG